MTVYEFSRPRIPPLSSPFRRAWIFVGILLAHLLVVGGPLAWWWLMGRLNPPKEIAFKVKLGDLTPSHAPVVGEPERLRPGVQVPAPAPAPPEPVVKPIPRPRPKPRPQAAEPVVKPKPRPKTKVTPRPKPRPRAVEPVVSPRPRSSAQNKPRTQTRPTRQQRASSVEEAQSQVYRPAGGDNFNRNVKIGSRDAGQVKGPADHKTPQGGLTKDEEAYYTNLKKFLDVKWVEPSRTHLGDLRPKATLELEIAADGRVLNARIVQASGNTPMDESVRRLIKVLDRVPTPPGGALKILVQMEVK